MNAIGAALTGLAGIGTAIFAGMPPERFQGDSAAVVFFVSDVSQICGKAPPGYVKLACHARIKGTSYIVLPNPCPFGATETFARLACHETAHSRGWGPNHEP